MARSTVGFRTRLMRYRLMKEPDILDLIWLLTGYC